MQERASRAPSTDSFFAAIREQTGIGLVLDPAELAQATRNGGAFERHVPGMVKVSSQEQLESVVTIAHRTRTPIFPFSRGMNWGYGSRLPNRSGAVLVDLSAMNRILEINEEFGFAEIEPGVTQKQLADELEKRGSRYLLDVTGSGKDTSILGNALERGIAYHSQRPEFISDLEIILANGTRIRTGSSRLPESRLRGLYPFGLGPSLDGLFFQSNLGIVSKAIVRLIPRPKRRVILTLNTSTERVPELAGRIRSLVSRGCLHGIPHLADRARTISTLIPLVRRELGEMNLRDQTPQDILDRAIRGDWTLTASIAGELGIVREQLRIVKKELAPLGRLFHHSPTSRVSDALIRLFATKEQKIVLRASRDLRGLHEGRPTDDGISFLLNPAVDHSPEGFLLCTPLAPLRGESAREFIRAVSDTRRDSSLRIGTTLNFISPRVLEAVISIHFRRDDADECARAHEWFRRMSDRFNAQGFHPYRINIDQAAKEAERATSQNELISTLKNAMDPLRILAPGRYL